MKGEEVIQMAKGSKGSKDTMKGGKKGGKY